MAGKRFDLLKRWAPVGLFLLAAALRFINLNGRPVWYDEAFAILYAEKSLGAILSGTLTPVQGAAADVHPVAFYFLLHGWMTLVGQSPLAVRMLSVWWGVGTVALVYRLIRELFSTRVACWSALVMALAPFQIAYSQETRMYAMLGFWSTAALVAWVRASRTDLRRDWVAFSLCGALALYSHNLGFALFAALGIAVMVRAIWVGSWKVAFKTALAGLGMGVIFVPWLMQVPGQFSKVAQAYWVTRPSILTLVQTLIAFAFDFENAVFPRWLLPFALFGALLVLTLVIWQAWAQRKSVPGSLGVLAMLAGLPVVIVFVISQWFPVYIIRGMIPAAIVYTALVGWALAVMPRSARIVFGAPLGVLVMVVLFAFYGYTGFPRGPYAALDAFLRAQSQPGDVILHSNKLTFFPAHLYDRTLPQVFLGDPPGSGSDTLARPTQEALGLFPTDLETATANHSRVWLIIFRQAVAEVEGDHVHLAWLSERFATVQTFTFGNMDVILFARRPV